MPTLYPIQDTFVRGELSPRLHARASLELYRAALSKCENFITLPHGGIRKRGGTYFVGEVKDSSKATRLIPFIFSSEQAYCLEFGDLYVRVYAYGARVGTVEVVTPWPEAALSKLQFIQSADVMWIVHPEYRPQTLTREAHTTWTLEEFLFEDGPYLDPNETSTTMTPASTGHITPDMTDLTTPSGTVSSSGSSSTAWTVFDRDKSTDDTLDSGTTGWVQYDLGFGSAIADAYWITSAKDEAGDGDMPTSWELQGSNNGSSWVTLDSRDGETGWGNTETRFFEFKNDTAYRYHRLEFRGGGGADTTNTSIAELAIHRKAENQTAFNLTASSTTGINGGSGFLTSDVGRPIRLLGSDNRWRWARVVSRSSSTVVTVQIRGHAFPDTRPIINWRMGAFTATQQPDAVALFEERLAFAKRFSVYASKTGDFDVFTEGEEDDDALEFIQAGGGQANNIVWLADADGFLVIATTGGIRALSGSGIDEALTPSSFKNRKSRTYGCAQIPPVDAGSSFLYVTNSRKAIAELVFNASGRFTSDDVGQVSEHIPKKGIIELAYQQDPDPLVWFPLDNGEVGCYTHQPAQEVRGLHRHRVGGAFSGSEWGIIERAIVTPGQDGIDDVWMIVKRTINGVTKRYIEIMEAAFEYGELEDAYQVDCGLTYEGAAAGTFSGLSHLEGEVVDVLAGGKVYKGLTVSAGAVTLPGSATATKAHIGLPFASEANTLELDVGARDGSLIGRRKKVSKVILSLFETDTSGLRIQSMQRGRWENVKIEANTPLASGTANLFTGNVSVPIDDSWEGQGKVRIIHDNPTPCTIRAITPVFDAEP